MRLKKDREVKTSNLSTRCTKIQKHKIIQKASIYCDGNISEYLLYAALNFVPSKSDFEEKKGQR